MTSASELFCNRRSRYGRNITELTIDSSSSFDRNSYHHSSNPHDNRRLNHHNHTSRRERFDLDGCDLPRRPSYHLRHRPSHQERDLIRPDQGGVQSSSGNVTISGETSNIRNRQRVTRNDRLPGSVLLARERLLERLRGVSVSGNRQSHGISFNINENEVTLGRDGGYDGVDVETENPRDWLAEVTANTYPRARRLVAVQETKKRPVGLTRDSIDRLHVEVFNKRENSDEETSRECSICLETFEEGEVVTCLPCEHKFHSCCLGPWVEACGDCPNCRTAINISAYKKPIDK